MVVILQIVFTKCMDLRGIVSKIDKEMDQVSWDAFSAVKVRVHFAVGDVSPDKCGIVLIAGFRDEDGM